ncbi:MAG: hypothetical protein ACOX47_13845 [Bacillota bacterium]|jgi:hypothetical protein
MHILHENTYPDTASYCYQAFGVKIASEIPVPELKTCPIGASEVLITLGKVPKDSGEAWKNKGYYQGKKDQLILRIRNVGSYLIKKGREIIIEPAATAEMKEVRLFLLGSAFGALLWQRGILPIHGSAVKVKEKCFIITGLQKAGKSTLAAIFRQDGSEILTDDIAPIYFNGEGDPWVYPSYPQQKLWQDSLESLGEKADHFSQISGQIDKYAVPLERDFCQMPQRLTAIYEMRKANCEKVSLFALSGVDKLELILNNVYRYGFADVMGYAENIFHQAVALAEKVAVSRVMRPAHLLTVKEIKTLIEQDLVNRGIV